MFAQICQVPFGAYLAASALGTVPLVAAYVYAGALLSSIADMLKGGKRATALTPKGTMLVAGAFLASLALMLWLWRVGAARVAPTRARQPSLLV